MTERTWLYGPLLKWTKSRFPYRVQLRPIARDVQSCGVGDRAFLHLAAGALVKGQLLVFRESLSHYSWCSKVGNAEGISESKIIC